MTRATITGIGGFSMNPRDINKEEGERMSIARRRESEEAGNVTTSNVRNLDIAGALFVSVRGACKLLGISKSTLWRLRTFNGFPRGIRFGGRDLERISVEAIKAWIAQQPSVDDLSSARGRRGTARYATVGGAASAAARTAK
jgi:predicted DNA-binding transcriptional regulator AlpA